MTSPLATHQRPADLYGPGAGGLSAPHSSARLSTRSGSRVLAQSPLCSAMSSKENSTSVRRCRAMKPANCSVYGGVLKRQLLQVKEVQRLV
jgi:hypothetical protein